MAQGQISIETATVLSAAQSVETLAENYHDAYIELYKIVDSLSTEGYWQGKDNESYVNQINGFKNDFQAMENLMRSYAEFLRKAVDGYKTIQKHTTDSVGKKLQTSAN